MSFAQTFFKLTFLKNVETHRAVKNTIPTIPPAGIAPVVQDEMQRAQGALATQVQPYTIKKGAEFYSLEDPRRDPDSGIEASEGSHLSDLYFYPEIPRDAFTVESVRL